MKELEERIRSQGRILPGEIIKVDSFLNHQVDTEFLEEMGKEFARNFADLNITKVMTLEASGIPPALMTARVMNVPLVFAKKSGSKNIGDAFYKASVTSYTYGRSFEINVSKAFLNAEDHVLLVDDFLATGSAIEGLMELCRQAGAKVEGIGICITKAHQGGEQRLKETGVRLVSLAVIESLNGDEIVFRDE